MDKKYLLKYFDNRGREVRKTCETEEQMRTKFRSARANNGGNFRQYSTDNGQSWSTF